MRFTPLSSIHAQKKPAPRKVLALFILSKLLILRAVLMIHG
ncbi:hypothetical protein B4134_0790 [Bacillus safensis]|nr:hypothetical protein B4129_0745 [Bacillus safensis]KIL18021.1 hypothetical protein B4107_0671 [Bacillus safensis]KIL23480.1 hypothetical protein B4134_0790 [Bacillus safensis]